MNQIVEVNFPARAFPSPRSTFSIADSNFGSPLRTLLFWGHENEQNTRVKSRRFLPISQIIFNSFRRMSNVEQVR